MTRRRRILAVWLVLVAAAFSTALLVPVVGLWGLIALGAVNVAAQVHS